MCPDGRRDEEASVAGPGEGLANILGNKRIA
jgi:hypothetical protein